MGSDDPTQAKRVWGHPEGARPKGVSDTITDISNQVYLLKVSTKFLSL